eukprot:gnl/TRDRNA2_/TRDRNA2_154332_c0_seq1.p1 gnl/TRDRNA2_/TRDRNA2_154332_c0~~gnl/TRDRNA2_/TRDRNA2_154332_c0_seq1.p1  ORF type:complete len:208 (+),score=48.45 gnl/TRDRNA2_/TRDRNA2_154332_c0_seq1:279-902(+)
MKRKKQVTELSEGLKWEPKGIEGKTGKGSFVTTLSDSDSTTAATPRQGQGPAGSLAPLLRALRPVAYRFKGEGTKPVRFGFIADELEESLPQVVRQMDGKEEKGEATKGIVYQDLIAVLTAALKGLQARVDNIEAERQAERLKYEKTLESLEMKVHALSVRLDSQDRNLRRHMQSQDEALRAEVGQLRNQVNILASNSREKVAQFAV